MKVPQTVEKILFVCYGNLCRSVLAEALMRRLLDTGGFGHISVASAGIGAFPDYPAPPRVVEVAGEHGLDVTGHRSRLLDESLLDWADIVLIVESYMGEEISRQWPDQDLERIFLLGLFAPGGGPTGEIQDPFGGSVDDFKRCYSELEASVQGLFEKLLSRKML